VDILDLAKSLPKLSAPPEIIVPGLGLEYISSQAGDYVAPELTERSPAMSAVQLITAPAAAGKSTSAKAVSAVTGGIYANLGGRRIADGSFSGLLDEAIGERPALDYRDLLRQDSATYVIDSLDETQLKSGELSFIAFLQGLCRFARGSEGRGNVLLFARLDTAEWIISTFEGEGVPLRVLQLDYFSEVRSNRYLELKLDRLYRRERRSNAPHRRYTGYYVEARNAVYRRVASALGTSENQHYWDNPEVARFLGYSPVLESIAAYLCINDFRQLDLGALDDVGAGRPGPEWRILQTLISSLLDREQGRLQEGFLSTEILRERYGIAASSLYTSTEQCFRLVQQVDSPSGSTGLPAGLPSELQSSYDQAVATLLKNHPFLSSEGKFVHPVFRDYAYAVALASISAGEGLVRVVLKKLRDGSTLPSAALAPFIVHLVEAQRLGLPGTRCDLLFESLQSQEDASFHYDFLLYAAHDDTSLLEARRVTSSGADQEAAIRVELSVDNHGIRLPASCRHLKVDTGGDLEVNAAGRVVRIGPEVEIHARTLTISTADAITIDSNDGAVLIDCELIMTPHLELRKYGAKLQVYADVADGPLSAYAISRPPHENNDIERTFYDLRRLLNFFRKTVHAPSGVLAADRGQMDTHLLGVKHTAAVNLVSRMRELGLITIHQRAYHLHLDQLASRGVQYDDFRTLPVSNALRSFLMELVERSE